MIKIRRVDWHFDEWIAGTVGMSLEEEGLYIRLVNIYYSHGGLPSDVNELAKLTHIRPQMFRRLWAKLARKFSETGAKLLQNRCETEMKLAENRLETARSNGAKGGKPKTYDNRAGKSPGIANQQPTTTISVSPNGDTDPKKRASAFGVFWKEYPHKVGRGAALRSWAKAIDAAGGLDVILDGLRRYVQTKPADRPWCNPATWLNQQRWLDEPAGTSAGKPEPNGVAKVGLSGDVDQWRRRLADYRKSGFWIPNWGFPPTDPDCYAPAEILAEMGFANEHLRT